MKKVKIKAIASMSRNRVIGKEGDLVFRDSRDMKRFSALTSGNTVVMGRKTYESLPKKFRPLPNRLNVVLTRNPDRFTEDCEDVIVISNLSDFLDSCESGGQKLPSDVVWIIGGAEVYKLALERCDEIYLTQVNAELEGDAYFPEFEEDFVLEQEERLQEFSFCRYVRVHSASSQLGCIGE